LAPARASPGESDPETGGPSSAASPAATGSSSAACCQPVPCAGRARGNSFPGVRSPTRAAVQHPRTTAAPASEPEMRGERRLLPNARGGRDGEQASLALEVYVGSFSGPSYG